MQTPLPWQLSGHASSLQSHPDADGWQKQTPRTQVPRDGPPQSEGHAANSHVGGAKPGAHSHLPPLHKPLPLQLLGQPPAVAGATSDGLEEPTTTSQLRPEKPSAQKHVPLRQRPWAPHPPSHVRSEQSAPVKPLSQAQPPVRWLQRPRPEQPFGHDNSEQSIPSKPAEHEQAPRTQTPRPWQCLRPSHVAMEQSSPLQPSSHAHCPPTQRPCLKQPGTHSLVVQ